MAAVFMEVVANLVGIANVTILVLLLYAASLAAGWHVPGAYSNAQTHASADVQAQSRKTSPPYTGDLSRFGGKDRARNLQVERVMDLLAIKHGVAVADIGAGSGWFTVRAARRTGTTGKVYAVDINPDFLQHIRERAQQDGLHNIETILDEEDDPRLPANSVDSVLLLKTYHEIAKPVPFLKNLRKALRPGARVGIIDRSGNGEDHGIDAAVVIDEARQAGLELHGQYDFVKADEGVEYFLVFTVRPN
ncbi:MAG TPA: class I SAM-dependent methyltransferase [Terriglobales bacterium]